MDDCRPFPVTSNLSGFRSFYDGNKNYKNNYLKFYESTFSDFENKVIAVRSKYYLGELIISNL